MIELTKPQVYGYQADDGTIFSGPNAQEECRKYEMTARCAAVSAAMKKVIGRMDACYAFDTFCTCSEDSICVFDIRTPEDLQVVNTGLLALQRDTMIDPKYIGEKVMVNIWLDDSGVTVMGTRKEVEKQFATRMDKLFDPAPEE